MLHQNALWIAQGQNPCYLLLNQANRHGIVTGASGTGKTVTLKVMAEGFSQAGVPVFLVDVKGDVTGIAEPGADSPNMQERIERFGIEGWQYAGCPTRLWCVGEGRGIPIRITVSDMGPELLARLLGLSEVQEGVLSVVFRVADEKGMLLIDLKDLRAMLTYVSEHAKEFEMDYGRVAPQSAAAIVRALVKLEDQGADALFGEPSLDLMDFTKKVIQVVKLIRSKGVGVYFISQSPSDIPDEVLAQLSNRIQHGLRAYTPAEQKAVRAAEAFVENPAFDSQEAILALGTGEALVSFLDEKGRPAMVENAKVLPPQCSMAAASQETIDALLAAQAPLMEKYGTPVDRGSAYELIAEEKEAQAEADRLAQERAKLEAERAAFEKERAAAEAKAQKAAEKEAARQEREAAKEAERLYREQQKEAERAQKARDKQVQQITKTLGDIGREAGKQILRGLFGTRR